MPAATSSKKDAEKYIVRGIGLIKTLHDIENIVVKEVGRHARSMSGTSPRCRSGMRCVMARRS